MQEITADPQTAVPCHQHFRHSGHTHRIGADGAQIADLSRGLIVGTREAVSIDALLQRNIQLRSQVPARQTVISRS